MDLHVSIFSNFYFHHLLWMVIYEIVSRNLGIIATMLVTYNSLWRREEEKLITELKLITSNF